MKLSDAVRDYLNFVRVEQGHSDATFTTYQSWLHRLERWMREDLSREPTLEDMTTPMLRRYLYSLQKLRPRTVRGAFHPIRGIAKFLVEQGVLTTDVSKGITLPKKDAAVRLTVSDDEVTKILDQALLSAHGEKALMRRAVIAALAFGGLRRQELLDLKLVDFDEAEGSLFIQRGKGNKSRKVYLPEEAIVALAEYVAARNKNIYHEYLFSVDTRRRLGDPGLTKLMEDVKRQAGFTGADNIKPHSLRHAAATRLLRNGADLRSIQAFLGHTNLQTTSVYLHTDEVRMKEVAHLGSLRRKEEEPKTIADAQKNRRAAFRRFR
jgi:site-specific recombinase XerD